MSKCVFGCGKELYWVQSADGKWHPFEDKDCKIPHDCPKKPIGVPRPTGTETAPPPSTQPAKAKVKVEPLSDEEILFVRKFRHWCKELAP